MLSIASMAWEVLFPSPNRVTSHSKGSHFSDAYLLLVAELEELLGRSRPVATFDGMANMYNAPRRHFDDTTTSSSIRSTRNNGMSPSSSSERTVASDCSGSAAMGEVRAKSAVASRRFFCCSLPPKKVRARSLCAPLWSRHAMRGCSAAPRSCVRSAKRALARSVLVACRSLLQRCPSDSPVTGSVSVRSI